MISEGALIVIAIILIVFTGPVNAVVFMLALWAIYYLISTFPGAHISGR